jgi:Spy/CpxP family protein refolding chaperone
VAGSQTRILYEGHETVKKKWIYLLVAGLSAATIATVDAQRVPFRGPRGAEMMDELGLSDEQKTQVQTLRDAHRKEMRSAPAAKGRIQKRWSSSSPRIGSK